uniref:Integrase core domain containing protein n=1 Tax=Solanum tuberosum TaxID=4113 RepID=M1E0W0_SOLTU
MVNTNIVMPPRKRARDITINERGSNPPKKRRQEPPPGNKGKAKRPIFDRDTTPRGSYIPSCSRGFYAARQNFLEDTLVAARDRYGTTVPPEVTPCTDAQVQTVALGTEAQTYGETA